MPVTLKNGVSITCEFNEGGNKFGISFAALELCDPFELFSAVAGVLSVVQDVRAMANNRLKPPIIRTRSFFISRVKGI